MDTNTKEAKPSKCPNAACGTIESFVMVRKDITGALDVDFIQCAACGTVVGVNSDPLVEMSTDRICAQIDGLSNWLPDQMPRMKPLTDKIESLGRDIRALEEGMTRIEQLLKKK